MAPLERLIANRTAKGPGGILVPPVHPASCKRPKRESPRLSYRRLTHDKRLFRLIFPAVPEVCVFAALGYHPECVAHLLFVKLAVGTGSIKSSRNHIDLGRARRSAEMADSAAAAWLNGFDLALGYSPERLCCENLLKGILANVASAKL